MRGFTHTGPSRTGNEAGSGGVKVCAPSGRETKRAIAMPPSAREQALRRPGEDAVAKLPVCTVAFIGIGPQLLEAAGYGVEKRLVGGCRGRFSVAREQQY